MTSHAPFGIEDITLVRRIGAGGFGTVYEAVQTTMGRTVALKVGNATITDDQGRRVFEAEARTLASAGDHPNVVTLHDAGISPSGRPYLVMEFAAGGSLGAALSAGRRLAGDDVARVGADLASALAHTHQRGIVHRDVKPANVLLTASGTVKLADFGVAAFTRERAPQDAATAGFVAPEVVSGRPAEPPADQWSLAATLVAAATGTPPIPGIALIDLGVDPSVAGVLERALRPDPATRWADCASFGGALRSTVTAPSAAMGPVTSGAALVSPSALTTLLGPDQRRRRSRRRAILLGAVALATTAVLAGGVLALTTRGGDETEVATAPPSTTAPPLDPTNATTAPPGSEPVEGAVGSPVDTSAPIFLTVPTVSATPGANADTTTSGGSTDSVTGNPVAATPPPSPIAPAPTSRATTAPTTPPPVVVPAPTQPPVAPAPAADQTSPPIQPATTPPTTPPPATVPSAPSGVAVTGAAVASWENPTYESVESVAITLAWQPAGDGGAAVTGHRIRLTLVDRATGNAHSAPTIIAAGPAASATVTVTKPSANVYARWEVAAVNAVGQGAFAGAGSWVTPNLLGFTYYYPAYHLVTMSGGVVNAHAFTTTGHTASMQDQLYGQSLGPGSAQSPGAIVGVWWRSSVDCSGFAPPAGGCNLTAPPAVPHHK